MFIQIKMSKLTLIIPVKNEKESLSIFLTELTKYQFKILLVIDPLDIDTKESIKKFFSGKNKLVKYNVNKKISTNFSSSN